MFTLWNCGIKLLCSGNSMLVMSSVKTFGVTMAAVPLLFRPGNPALCVGAIPWSSHISVDWGICCVLCLYVCLLCFYVNCVIYVCLQYFDTVGWVFLPVKTVTRITYTVLVETLNHALSIYLSIYLKTSAPTLHQVLTVSN